MFVTREKNAGQNYDIKIGNKFFEIVTKFT
jgi:hypothetical protein